MDDKCFFVAGLSDHKDTYIKYLLQSAFNPSYLSIDKFDVYTNPYGFYPSTQLDADNKFVEREFKTAVLKWLTNGEVKLFKSPVENNHLVRLINISTSPEEKLGRMLHTVSASAVELEEYNNENIKKRNM
jgi:hypothetical protein